MKEEKKGVFISFEGIDGSGKTVQCNALSRRLKKEGYQVMCVREPGGTSISEKIRLILLDQDHHVMDAMTELFLYEAARSQLLIERIRPALKRGEIVLCDRFIDSTIAYQGFGRRLSLNMIYGIHNKICGQAIPDRTFILHIPWEESCRRRFLDQKNSDRMENEESQFFRRIIEGYETIAKEESNRVKLVDGMKPAGEIEEEVFNQVMNFLHNSLTKVER